jgi:ribonuclease Z
MMMLTFRQGGLPMYVATRGLYRMKPPTIIVPISVKEDVEKLFEIHRKMDHSELKHNLIGLDVGNCCSQSRWILQLLNIQTYKFFFLLYIVVSHLWLTAGEEFSLRNDLKVKAFRTYHVIPSQVATH